MLSIIGDILNWAVAGFFYPLLMIPLAVFLATRCGWKSAHMQTVAWICLTVFVVLVGYCFVYLVPGQSATPISIYHLGWLGFIFILGVIGWLQGGPNKWRPRLAQRFEAITLYTGKGVMWLIFVMAFVQFMVVILRYVFGMSFIWMQESITYMHGAVFLLAAGYALLTDDHVRVDIFYREASEKRKALINLLGTYFLLVPVCMLILWAGAPYIFASWEATEGSNEASGLQLLYILKSLIPSFAVLMMIAGFCIASNAVTTLLAPSTQSKRG